MNFDTLRNAIVRADAGLSRCDPLERILLREDFAGGFHGWQTYFPDYDGWTDYAGRYEPVEPLREILEKSRRDPAIRIDRRLPVGPRAVPMLSGSALKVPTLARAGHKAFAQKRLGSPWRGKFRIECRFAFSAGHSASAAADTDVGALYLTCDVMDRPPAGREPLRWWPALRYLHAEGGRLERRWQFNQGDAGVKDGPWQDVPGGGGGLDWARPAAEPPIWHDLRFTFDLGRREYCDFSCDGREFPVAGLRHEPRPPLSGWRASTDKCPGLIGTGFGIETAADRRCFLYLDSVLVSAGEA